jgi:hypothetical protein
MSFFTEHGGGFGETEEGQLIIQLTENNMPLLITDNDNTGSRTVYHSGNIPKFLLVEGGTMTGTLVLHGDPAADLEAATKQYVDASVATGGGGGIPEAPTDGKVYGRVGSIQQWMAVVQNNGGTMTGPLILHADPTQVMGAATKQYVDNRPATDPTKLPLAGGTMTGVLALFADPTSDLDAATKRYVDANAGGEGGIPEAPVDGQVYGRSGSDWVSVVPKAGGAMTGALSIGGDVWPQLTLLNPGATSWAGIQLSCRPGQSNCITGAVGDNDCWDLNFGDDLSFTRYDNLGQSVDDPLTIKRDSGDVLVAHEPTALLGVATKGYVDAKVATGGGGITQAQADARYVNVTGDNMSAGLKFGSNTVAAPGDLSKHITLYGGSTGFLVMPNTVCYVSEWGFAHKWYIGGTLKLTLGSDGLLTLAGDPTANLGAATKQYVDSRTAPLATSAEKQKLDIDAVAADVAVLRAEVEALKTAAAAAATRAGHTKK